MKKKHRFVDKKKFVKRNVVENSAKNNRSEKAKSKEEKVKFKEEPNQKREGFGYEDIAAEEEKKIDHGLIFERLISRHDEEKKSKTLKDEISELNQIKLSREEKEDNGAQKENGEISFDNLLKDGKDLKLNITDEEINEISEKGRKKDSGFFSVNESLNAKNGEDRKIFKIQFVKDEKKPFIQKVGNAERNDYLQEFALFSVCSDCGQKDVSISVCEKLGIRLKEFDDFSCCCSGLLDNLNPNLSLVINARNMAIAQVNDLSIVTLDNNCRQTLSKAGFDLENEDMRKEINKTLNKINLKIEPGIKIKSVLEIIMEYPDPSKFKSLISQNLSGLKIAPFYGANFFVPQKYFKGFPYYKPDLMEKLILFIGGQVFDFPEKTNNLFADNQQLFYKNQIKLVGEICKNLEGASLIVTPCVSQQVLLDSLQKKARKYSKVKTIPVLHVSQLVGLGMGMGYKELGLHKLRIRPKKLLKKNGLYF